MIILILKEKRRRRLAGNMDSNVWVQGDGLTACHSGNIPSKITAVYIALLRGINVGGTGLLAMKELIAICANLGFSKTKTYIQSGNVIFESGLSEDAVRDELEKALEVKMGKSIAVVVRTRTEMRATLEANPFADKEGSKVAVVFLTGKPPADQLRGLTGPAGEQVQLGNREVYVYYPEGMGRSKLKLPLPGAVTTVRNINTVSKLVELAQGYRPDLDLK